MGRRRLLRVLLGACVLLFMLPALASAASYDWNQPGDFTATGSGANPDHDAYGGTPWSYDEGPTCSLPLCPPSHDPSGFQTLPSFSSGTWSDGASRFIGSNGSALQVGATSTGVTALGWTNPLGHSASVRVTGTVGTPTSGSCDWSLDQGGTSVQSGTAGGPNDNVNATMTVPKDGSVYLTLNATPSLISGTCVAPATLDLTVSEPTPVTLTNPANGSTTSSSQPAFTGQATTDYASSSTVTVKVYAGSSASGTPLQTLTTTRSNSDGSFSVAPSAPLSAGTYTAQAFQSIPGDSGQSTPTTFQVGGSSSPVTLNQPPSAGPLTTSSPVLTGQSGGDATTVAVNVYAGRRVGASPVRALNVSRNVTTGTYAVTITPPLPDGEYTAIASQQGSQPGTSNPVTFRIKAHAPALSVSVPRRGGSVFGPRPTFLGGAGSTLGDAPAVTVTLHQGSSSTGPTLGRRTVPVVGGSWILKWSRPLANGFYNLVVQQGDDAGHTSLQYVSFLVVPTPPVIGSRVSLRGSTASVAITCTAGYGSCSGTVLALSTRQLRTRAASPFGYVRVVFAYVRIGAGQTAIVRTRLPGYVAAALRRVHRLQVRVTVSMVGVGRVAATRSVQG